MPAKPEPNVRVVPILAQIAFVVVAALFVYGFVAVGKEGETRRVCSAPCFLHPDYMAADRRAPGFSLQDLHGATVTLDSLRGKVVVLNFWTKTCGPCLEEMNSFAKLSQVLHSRPDVAVVAVSTDDDAQEVKDTLKSVVHEPIAFETMIDPDAEVVRGKFGTDLFPETWIIDAHGIVRARFDGGRDWSDAAVVELIDEIRAGTYCPLSVRQGKLSSSADAVKLCQSLSGAEDE